ncbi:MAG TPA: hypothetical protein VFO10_22340 [Oligoflexus sp.]|uniref:hypothetical protein n=1 Tax=Oligoflexus sp. TaxID=1971216 RepID=UPI002D7FA081|nr:hypothetical protein [Oligoflexus sp.]HET9240018.1 hypothetical protein [Oligoflexus sp.]
MLAFRPLRKRTLLTLVLTFAPLVPEVSLALPIGFGRNQGDLIYKEIQTPNFFIYHDARTPHEGQLVLESLESARPKLEEWLQVKRTEPLKVILSSTTSNPSFANFITDAVELQTLGRGGRDLAWHEYTHSSMYRHLDNIFGPAGSIIHLPWMPAWWIEGLAEAMSVSNGSDLQYGIERYYALHGNWPSYDKLHALYDGSRFSTIGYAISGAFVSYILRTYDASKLPQVMRDFYDYSMPWWWPWTFVPFNGFMPMDQALENYTGKNGPQLYEDYKAAATKYWKSQQDLAFYRWTNKGLELKPYETLPASTPGLGLPGEAITFNSTFSFQSRGDKLMFVQREGGDLFEAEVTWKNDIAQDYKRGVSLPDDALTVRLVRKNYLLFTTGEVNDNLDPKRTLWIQKGEAKVPLMTRSAYISQLFMSDDKLVWFEEFLEKNQLCWAPRQLVEKGQRLKNADIRCPLVATYPQSLNILGYRSLGENDTMTEVWLNRSEETLYGDRHQILRWSPEDGRLRDLPQNLRGKPISVAFNARDTWLALADRSHHFLRRLDKDGRCVEERDLANIVTSLHNSTSDLLMMALWQESGALLVKTNHIDAPVKPCRLHDEPTSPLIRAMHDTQKPLKELMAQADPWQNRAEASIADDQKRIASAPILGQRQGAPIKDAEDINWRGRPVFAFPWIGYDALGLSYGALTVPLMDHMQNEHVQLIALYGAESRYPDIQLSAYTTRFKTTYTLDVFRRQTWNRNYGPDSYYFDERGAEIGALRYIHSLGLSLSLSLKNAWMIPYLGDDALWDVLAKGYLREFNIGLSKSHGFHWGYLSYYLNSSIASKQFNANYDYEKTGVGINMGIPISILGQPTSQSWGASYSRVRGSRRKFLQEAYSPLRTFIPGSGGGLNEINSQLYGDPYLTNLQYGDTQGRLQFAWTTPLVADIAKLLHIVYLQRLDATAFYNYGRAWFQQIDPRFDSGTAAHGYKLDLQADVKGVKLNVGLGTGQVVGQDWEVFGLIGFDALIDQDKR